ncbi:uncharacterized protein AB9W97_008065 [Spinachia spinachia]
MNMSYHSLSSNQMIQAGSGMLTRMAFGFVYLICSLTDVSAEADIRASPASARDRNRKTCVEIQRSFHKAVCWENQLYPGKELSYCGGQGFNPEEATCCKVQDGSTVTAFLTQGLSQKVSDCCGLKAYNELNEICCGATILIKPGPIAECCGKEAFSSDTQLCCGPSDDKKILQRESKDHLCCGHNQFHPKKECCCLINGGLQKEPIASSCSMEPQGVQQQV